VLTPNEEIRITVRATCPVIGLWPDQVAEVYPSPRVELLLSTGHLVWVDEPDYGSESQEESDADLDD
jgi:hypothetical protein